MSNTYILTKSVHVRLVNTFNRKIKNGTYYWGKFKGKRSETISFSKLYCRHCSSTITIGQYITTTTKARYGGLTYCKKCAKRLHIW